MEVVTSYTGQKLPRHRKSATDSDAHSGGAPASSADGEALSFEQVYGSERAALLALAMVLTGNRLVAEDLTQEAFLRLEPPWDR